MDDILNDLILVAQGTVKVNFNAKEETKMRLKHLFIEVVGDDTNLFDGSNTQDNYSKGVNDTKDSIRYKIKSL